MERRVDQQHNDPRNVAGRRISAGSLRRQAGRVGRPEFEALEPRVLLAGDFLSVSAIEADNRGQVVLRFTRDVDQSTIDSALSVTTAGTDGLFGTADDVATARSFSYDAATRSLTVNAPVAADVRYRVRLDASLLRDTQGGSLDGEFNGGSTISGDAVAGGDLVFFTRRAAEQIARFTTVLGVIDVTLFSSQTPLTVQNFNIYANRGVWDTTFFHRGANFSDPNTGAPVAGGSNFVIQGGGFTAAPGFANIPADPPVQNEPGISNLRGTIAMAKLGNNPNSATNQWFFNLGNNASNLDNQNGGFTVFGEVRNAAGLAVMDALAALSRFDAGSTNGAFNRIPVLDLTAVQNRGSIVPEDLARVTRIAILVDVTGEATQQLPTAGSVVINGPTGDVRVTLFDLDGTGAVGDGSWLKVTFGRNDSISNIRIASDFNGRVGIAVSGASSIGSITDSRRSTTAAGDLAFIVTNTRVSTMTLARGPSGYNLNGFVVPGQTLADDIDADGDVSDRTAILVGAGGPMTSLRLLNGLGGDVVAPGGIVAVSALGQISNADFELGTRGANARGSTFVLGRVEESEIRTPDAITSIRATEWLDTTGRADRIRAASLITLVTTGDRRAGVAGNFEAGLQLTRTGGTTPVITAATITGDIAGSVWNVAGPVNQLIIRGAAIGWTLSGATSIGVVQVGDVTQSSLTTTGELRRLTARSWSLGEVRARTAGPVQINGNFDANLTITGAAGSIAPSIRSFNVTGGSTGATVNLTGFVPTFTIRGPVDSLNMTVGGDNSGTFSFGPMTNSRVNSGNNNIDQFNAASFNGGELRGNVYFNINIAGPFTGEIRPNFIDNLDVKGDFSGTINSRIVNNIRITGAVIGSNITLTQQFNPNDTSSRVIEVGGGMIGSEIRSTGSIDRITVRGLTDSGIYVGAGTVVGLPNNATGINTQARVNNLVLRPSATAPNGLNNSVVVIGRLGTGLIERPLTSNLGRPFGVAVGDINRLDVVIDGRTTQYGSASPSPAPVEDFQILFDFLPATV